MFKVNDVVVYGAQGVCKILDVEEKEFMGEKRKYFVLRPVDNQKSTYFVPMNNENLLSKMRELLSKKEIDELIDSMPNQNANWIANDSERKEKYKCIISEGNRVELIKVIKAIYLEKKRREENKKRLTSSDERFLNDAEHVLHGEFQYVLGLDETQLMEYISERIEKNGVCPL